jgi:hypothetical protein
VTTFSTKDFKGAPAARQPSRRHDQATLANPGDTELIDMDIGNFAGLASHRRNLKELSAVCAYADDGEHAVEWARQAQRIDRSQ